MSIRRAEARDTEDILRLLVQVNMVHHNGRPDLFKGPATKYTAEQLQAIFADDSRPVFVLTDEEEHVQGYAFCILQQHVDDNILTDVKSLYIDDLCVDENVRGAHVGSRLYRHVCGYAKSIGCYNVTLNVWACNENALRFYEHMGLRPQKIGMEVLL